MKGWVGLVGWPVADGLPTLVVTHQLQVERRTKSSPVRDQRSTTVPRHQYHGKNAERDLYIWLCQLVNTTTSVVSVSLLEYEYTAGSSVVHCWLVLGALCNYSQLLFCIAWLMLFRLQFQVDSMKGWKPPLPPHPNGWVYLDQSYSVFLADRVSVSYDQW